MFQSMSTQVFGTRLYDALMLQTWTAKPPLTSELLLQALIIFAPVFDVDRLSDVMLALLGKSLKYKYAVYAVIDCSIDTSYLLACTRSCFCYLGVELESCDVYWKALHCCVNGLLSTGSPQYTVVAQIMSQLGHQPGDEKYVVRAGSLVLNMTELYDSKECDILLNL